MRDSHLLPLFVFGTLMVTGFALAIIFSLVVQKHRQVRNTLDKQRLVFEYEQSLLNTKIEVHETTLKVLSQELHDNINQELIHCFQQIIVAENESLTDERGKALKTAKISIKGVMHDIRLLSHNLNAGLIERRTTEDAVNSELELIRNFGKLECTLKDGSSLDLDPSRRLLVFRIVQEALQNILKHAEAKHIEVIISNTETDYTLIVQDDGKGIHNDDYNTTSIGISNMRERASMLGGTLTVLSTLPGTQIVLKVPLHK